MDKVLVVYASKYGSTAEIAEIIGQVVRQDGLHAEVKSTDDVRDITQYQAVILGSAVYLGNWYKKGIHFLQTNEKTLAQRPVWIFSSGPTGNGNRGTFISGETFPETLQPIADRIQVRDTAVFGGMVDINRLNFLEKWMMKKTDTPLGDFRDWNEITSWASLIASDFNGRAK